MDIQQARKIFETVFKVPEGTEIRQDKAERWFFEMMGEISSKTIFAVVMKHNLDFIISSTARKRIRITLRKL
jgi:hypothetical protein